MKNNRKIHIYLLWILIALLIINDACGFPLSDKQPQKYTQRLNNTPLKDTNSTYNQYSINQYPESLSINNGSTGLLWDSEFNSSLHWKWTSSENITATRMSPDNLTLFSHNSPYYISTITNKSSSANNRKGIHTIVSGNLSDTYVKDGVSLHLQERYDVLNGYYKLTFRCEFIGIDYHSSFFNLKIYLRNTPFDNFRLLVYNYTNDAFTSFTDFNYTSFNWLNVSFNRHFVSDTGDVSFRIRDLNRTRDTTTIDSLYLDYIALESENVTYYRKSFNQVASINQTFFNPAGGTFNLSFDYKVASYLHINSTRLQIHLWNKSRYLGIIWERALYNITLWTHVQQDLSLYLANQGVYNLSISLNITLNNDFESNLSLFIDNVQIYASPALSVFHNVDSSYLQTFENRNLLQLEFNFSLPLKSSILQLNFSLFYRALNESFLLYFYNFSADSWDFLAFLNSPTWSWINITFVTEIANMISVSNLTRFKIVDNQSSDNENNPLQIDFFCLQRLTLPTTITILQAPSSEVQVGDDVNIQLFFNDSKGNPITGAKIAANYTEDSYFVTEQGSGNYTLIFYTALVSPGPKWINITAQKLYYSSAFVILNFSVGGFPSNITIFQGGKKVNQTWYADPQPYVNDTSKKIRVYYNGSFGLKKAQIYAQPSWNNESILPFLDLGVIYGPAYNGLYDINLDTTGLHAYETHSVRIIANKEGYNSANITLNLVIQPLNTTLSLEGFENLTYYEGQVVTLGLSYIDIVNNRPILITNPLQGSIVWKFENYTAINGSMELFVWSYKAELDLATIAIVPGHYSIRIDAWATDYTNASATISLTILAKYELEIIFLKPPLEVMTDSSVTIKAKLTYRNNTPLGGEAIKFSITFGTSTEPLELISITNPAGIAKITFTFRGSETPIFVTITFDGNVSINSAQKELIIQGITPLTLFLRATPIWSSITILVVIGFVLFEFRIRRPRKRQRLNKLQNLMMIFQDVQGIDYILLIYKKSGVPIFEYSLRSQKFNPILLGGFLNAISSFKDGLLKSSKSMKPSGWELDYQDFKISWVSGTYVYLTILSHRKLSPLTREGMKKLLLEFEQRFQNDLLQFNGIIKTFSPAEDLLRKYLEIDLGLPQVVNTAALKHLKSVKKVHYALIGLAINLEEETGSFFLSKLLSTAASARGESDLTLFEELYHLWKNEVFIPQSQLKKEEKEINF
ncbi:MAG: hypothetical protein ACTSRS_01010 [Candidatus Helarchaeota archaeon]